MSAYDIRATALDEEVTHSSRSISCGKHYAVWYHDLSHAHEIPNKPRRWLFV